VAHEALGRGGAGRGEDACTVGVDGFRLAVVDGAGVLRPIPEWRCALYQEKNRRQNARACSIESKRAGNPGRYVSVLD